MADQRPPEKPHLFLQDIDELSRQFITRFYRNDEQWCITHCMPDVTYLGSTHDFFVEGVNGLLYLISNIGSKMDPSLVISLSVKTRSLSDGQCALALADYCLVTDPASGGVRALKKRATLIWVVSDLGPRLQYVQFTTPLYDANGDEAGPWNAHETYVYANVLLDQVIRRSAVPLHDIQGTLWSVAAAEVRLIEAHRQQTILHCMDSDIILRRGFADVVRQFGDKLIVVHRSFAVNPSYVRSASHAGILLDDGTFVPIPQRRAKEVREELERAIKKAALSNTLSELSLSVVDR